MDAMARNTATGLGFKLLEVLSCIEVDLGRGLVRSVIPVTLTPARFEPKEERLEHVIREILLEAEADGYVRQRWHEASRRSKGFGDTSAAEFSHASAVPPFFSYSDCNI
jgi:hypothetical protein